MTRTDLSLLGRWLRARVVTQMRTSRALVFTFAFPLVLLVLFNGLYAGARVDAVGATGHVRFAQFYTPSIGIFSLTTACYTSVIIGLATARDSGLLKRVRGTPLPMGVFLGSWLTAAAITGVGAVVLLFAVAVPAFGVEIYPRLLPAAIVTLVLGAASLSAVGLAVASVVKNAEQAMPVAQLTFLPVSFISGIWFPLEGAPDWLVQVAHFFPLSHIVEAFDRCFVAQTPGGGWSPHDLWAIAVWGVAGLVVAARRFHAEPGVESHAAPRRQLRRPPRGGRLTPRARPGTPKPTRREGPGPRRTRGLARA
jgi:ABC-2 type transport system permease protein